MAGVLLDNEAVQALADPRHRKHRATLAIVQMALGGRRQLELVIPTSVQVEAGWDRSDPVAAPLNRLRARRPSLDGPAADRAAAIVRALRISVADAHIAEVLASPDGPDVVLTSDTDDLGRIVAHTGAHARIVRL